jgi:undecaprenyl-diphosphatase
LFIAAAALFAFFSIADEALEGDSHEFDHAVLLALRAQGDPGNPIGPRWLEEAARDVTALGSMVVLTLVTLLVAFYLAMARKRGGALLVVLSVGGGILLSSLLKAFIERARPDVVPHLAEVFTASFPSGHATMSAITYLTLGVLLARVEKSRRLKAYLLATAVLLSLLVGLSRIYLGVHWPTDVLAGWCIGAAWAMSCWFITLWLQRKGEVA